MKLKNKFSWVLFFAISSLVISSCKKDTNNDEDATSTFVACSPASSYAPTGTGYRLIFKFVFDSMAPRLDNIGNPATMPSGHAGQSPRFNFMSQHYVELANLTTLFGAGQVLYNGATTTAGGASAIDFCASTVSAEDSVFFSAPLNTITAGSYSWLRISLAYQDYNISYKSQYIPTASHMGVGTVASFLGFDTYIAGYKINGHSYQPSSTAGGSGNHLQGYWGFEYDYAGTTHFVDGQSASGTTTVPNPIASTSPIPAGSCVVTGQFVDNLGTITALTIPASPTADIVITVKLSTNKSFEWIDTPSPDGYYQPELGDAVIDMGVRGMVPVITP